MTLAEFVENYGGNVCITIDGYCEEESYDYFAMPTDCYGEPDEDALLNDNSNHYKPSCLAKEPWWEKVKDRQIRHWNIIGGNMDKVELIVELEW